MSWIYTPAQLSIIGYLTAIGTIDNEGTGDAHTIGAVFFFIVLFLVKAPPNSPFLHTLQISLQPTKQTT